MKNEKTTLDFGLSLVKEYDDATLSFAKELFTDVATDCKWHCIDELEIEMDENVEFHLYDTREYLEEIEKTFKYAVDRSELMSYGRSYYDGEKQVVMIHGSEINIGMTKWMEDYKQFEKMVFTLMELSASDGYQQYVIRDKDFAKEEYEMVQKRLAEHKAA